MTEQSSAIVGVEAPISTGHRGVAWGLLGVAAFSFTVPLTRIAVEAGQLSPLFVGAGRAVVAAVLAGAAILLTRQPAPRGKQWISVAIVAAGAVVGFPLLTSFALLEAPASHGAVVIAILPAVTAVVAALRGRERPGWSFWIAAGAGALVATAFAATQGGDVGRFGRADLLLLVAVLVCALAYAEGGVLARQLGSWQTISWALVVGAPLMAVLTGLAVVQSPPAGSPVEWLAFWYLGVVSMFLGFVAWYRGLAIGPMSTVSQVQLAQPVMSLCWAALILHEAITVPTIIGGAAVIGCALLAVRSKHRVVGSDGEPGVRP